MYEYYNGIFRTLNYYYNFYNVNFPDRRSNKVNRILFYIIDVFKK